MRIRFLADVSGYTKGTILDVDDSDAEALGWIKDAKCEEVKATDPAGGAGVDDAKINAAVEAAESRLTRRLDEVVTSVKGLADSTEQIRKAATRKPINVSVTSDPIEADGRCGFKSWSEVLRDGKRIAAGGGMSKTWERFTNYAKQSGLNTVSPSEGGFLVPEEFANEVLSKAHDTSLVWSKARTIPINRSVSIPAVNESSRATGSRWGGVQVYHVAEGQTGTASKPDFGKIKLELKKLFGLCYITDEMMEDSPVSVDAIINQAFQEEFGWTLDNEFIGGSGAGAALGVLNGPATISVSKETGQTAATVVYNNIKKMWARLWNRSRGNTAWFINQDVLPQLMDLQMPTGVTAVPVYLPPTGVSGSPFGTIFGRPVIEIEQCATLGTVGDIILADFTQYIYAPKAGGMKSASSTELRFLYDETAIKFSMRYDGQPWWKTALTPANGSNTVSPFITLATRS